jgi:hypothetical protein
MYQKHRAAAEFFVIYIEFFVIYIREAHPGQTLTDVGGGKRKFGKTTTMDQRKEAANACLTSLQLTMPFLIDDMAGTVEKAYTGHPNRIYVVDIDGRVAMKGPRGPRGADITGAGKSLQQVLDNGGRMPAAK